MCGRGSGVGDAGVEVDALVAAESNVLVVERHDEVVKYEKKWAMVVSVVQRELVDTIYIRKRDGVRTWSHLHDGPGDTWSRCRSWHGWRWRRCAATHDVSTVSGKQTAFPGVPWVSPVTKLAV